MNIKEYASVDPNLAARVDVFGGSGQSTNGKSCNSITAKTKAAAETATSNAMNIDSPGVDVYASKEALRLPPGRLYMYPYTPRRTPQYE